MTVTGVQVGRYAILRARGKGALAKFVDKALKAAGWGAVERGLPIYLVGGSWRAIARISVCCTAPAASVCSPQMRTRMRPDFSMKPPPAKIH